MRIPGLSHFDDWDRSRLKTFFVIPGFCSYFRFSGNRYRCCCCERNHGEEENCGRYCRLCVQLQGGDCCKRQEP